MLPQISSIRFIFFLISQNFREMERLEQERRMQELEELKRKVCFNFVNHKSCAPYLVPNFMLQVLYSKYDIRRRKFSRNTLPYL